MTRDEAKEIIEDLKYSLDISLIDMSEINEIDNAMAMAIKSLEAWKEVKQDLYKFASDSFDAECAECYRIALRCVEGHLKEIENDK